MLTYGHEIDESSLKSLLPNELTLWIDPKEVSYRIGENGSICVLYDADNHVTKPEASREGIPRSTPTKKLSSSLEDDQMISRANNCSPTDSSLSSTPSSLSSPSTSSSPDWCLRDNSSPVSANHQIVSTTLQSVTTSTSLKMNPSEVRYTADNHNLNFMINSSLSVNPNQAAAAAVVAAVSPSTPIAAAAAPPPPPPPPPSSISTVTVNSNTNCRPASTNTASNINHWTYAYHWQPSSRIENYGSYHHQTAQYPIHQNRRPTCQQSIQIGHTAQTQLHHNKSPTSYTGYTSWDNFIFDKGVTSRHTAYHALNTNIEQLSAYVSG